MSAISANVQQEAAQLRANGPVTLPGLVKLGEAVADFEPKAVYISASGTTESKDAARPFIEDGLEGAVK